jgi:hypothetical protein
MCGKCGMTMAKIGCGTMALGVMLMVGAMISRLSHMDFMMLGPRGFAAGSALMLLLSIAAHTCQMCCFDRAEEPPHSH